LDGIGGKESEIMTNEEKRAYLKKWNEKKRAEERKNLLEELKSEINGLTFYWGEVHPQTVLDSVDEIINKYIEREEEKAIWQD
jgi:hypothetical protein